MKKYPKIMAEVAEAVQLIVVDAKGMAQGQERAGKFLQLNSTLANFKLHMELGITKLQTMVDISYTQAFMKASGGTVTEKKLNANGDLDYLAAKEELGAEQARLKWANDQYRIFDHSHILFRNVGK